MTYTSPFASLGLLDSLQLAALPTALQSLAVVTEVY